MIIPNGYIKFKTKSGGGYNEETGTYKSTVESLSDNFIPCQWRALSSSFKGRSNGEAFVMAQYEVLIDMQPIHGERFVLFDLDKSEFGEYSPISIDRYELVNIIKILV